MQLIRHVTDTQGYSWYFFFVAPVKSDGLNSLLLYLVRGGFHIEAVVWIMVR